MIGIPIIAQAQIDHSKQNYEITLYDAETIARLNPTKPVTPIQTPATSRVVNTQALTPSTNLTSPPQEVILETAPPAPVSRFPRDISAEFIEVIAGVPIMKDPQSCGKGLLEIGVTVEKVKNNKGIIVADLHDDVKENFLVWDEVILRVRATPTQGETKFCMPLTKPGDYAIAIYHDKNGNKEFDKNFLGIPSERFGMSNNPKFGLKSPEYEQAVFTVPEDGKDIRIKLLKASDVLGSQKK